MDLEKLLRELINDREETLSDAKETIIDEVNNLNTDNRVLMLVEKEEGVQVIKLNINGKQELELIRQYMVHELLEELQ